MRNDELWIDGQLMDLDDDTKITLKLKSNVFTDVSKIVSNNSYTVKLPKTVHNQKVIGHSDIPAYMSNYAYEKHRARYFRNGVEIIKDGVAVLMAVSDKIEMVLVWGSFVNFSKIVDEGISLTDLLGDDVMFFPKVNRASQCESYPNSQNYFFAYYNSRKYSKEEITNNNEDVTDRNRPSYSSRGDIYPLHPVVRVPWILERIEETTRVRFDFSGKGKELVDSLLIPLTERKSNEQTLGKNHECKVDERSGFGNITYKVTKGLDIFTPNTVGVSGSYFKVKTDSTVRFTFKGMLKYNYTAPESTRVTGTDGYVRVIVEVDGVQTIIATVRDRGRGRGWQYLELSGFGTVSMLSNQQAYVKFQHIRGGHRYMESVKLCDATLICSPNVPDEVPFNAYFPIVSNLPDIKVLDFIKALACLAGVFPKQENGVVKFISLDDIYQNKAVALDWTKRVVASGKDNKPKSMEYTVGDYCQHNRYKWKEDDTVEGDYNGDMFIDNKTLDFEKDVITMPFAASDGTAIPMYEYKEGEGDTPGAYILSSVKPRIMQETKVTISNRVANGPSVQVKSCANFDNLDFDKILNERYQMLSEVLNQARIIKENILVSEYDLMEFDESVPVYLGQYGKYFAVIEIKAESNGIAEVQLLQL